MMKLIENINQLNMNKLHCKLLISSFKYRLLFNQYNWFKDQVRWCPYAFILLKL